MRKKTNTKKQTRALYVTISCLLLGGCSGLMTQQETLARWHPNDRLHQSLSTSELRRIAEAGSIEAKFDLAVRLMEGDRVTKDEKEAVRTIEKVAEYGDPRAQYLLASAYISGRGKEKDETEGVNWLERSAQQGYFNSEYWYGYMLTRGRGVQAKNWREGLKWIRKAAQHGHGDAQATLGEAYENCRGGLHRDFDAAALWYRRAENMGGGSIMAGYNLRRLIDLGLVEWQEGDAGMAPIETVSLQSANFENCDQEKE